LAKFLVINGTKATLLAALFVELQSQMRSMLSMV